MHKKLSAGDLVEVRNANEIAETLDDKGCLDGLPFMPEMLTFVGHRFRVSKRAHKTCDTVHQTGGRRLRDCVHLEELRCDGAAHDECGAACLVFWKEAWLRPVSLEVGEVTSKPAASPDELSEFEKHLRSRTTEPPKGDGPVYRCQATALFDATEPLPWWDLRQYGEDISSGNVSVLRMLRVLFFHGLYKLAKLGVGYRLWRGIYSSLQPHFGGHEFPSDIGSVPDGAKTPKAELGLRPGDTVRVKSHKEILRTLDRHNKNRGMRFDEEMVPYCGGTYKVLKRVDRIIHETSGEMIELKTPCVILDGVVCKSEMSSCRLFCPRAITSYWREIWLERVPK